MLPKNRKLGKVKNFFSYISIFQTKMNSLTKTMVGKEKCKSVL